MRPVTAGLGLARIAGILAAIACAALPGCTESGTRDTAKLPADSLPLQRDTAALSQTDSLAYLITYDEGRYAGRALVMFRNRTPDTAYFVNCNGATAVQVQREVNGGWVDAWTSAQDACLSGPIVVAPGDSLQRPVLLFDGYHPHDGTIDSLPAREPAVHRLVWVGLVHDFNGRPPLGRPLPLEQRASNRFLLTGAPR